MERKLCKLLFASSSISQFLSRSNVIGKRCGATDMQDETSSRDFPLFTRWNCELCIQSIIIINSIWIGTSKIKSLWWWRWKLRWIMWNCMGMVKKDWMMRWKLRWVFLDEDFFLSLDISCAHANEETNEVWICRNSVSERWKGEVSNESTSLKHWKMSRHFPRSELFLFCWKIREILFVLIQFFSYLPSFTNSPAVVVLKWSWKPSRYGKLRKIARRPRQLSLLKRNYIFI